MIKHFHFIFLYSVQLQLTILFNLIHQRAACGLQAFNNGSPFLLGRLHFAITRVHRGRGGANTLIMGKFDGDLKRLRAHLPRVGDRSPRLAHLLARHEPQHANASGAGEYSNAGGHRQDHAAPARERGGASECCGD